MVDRLAAVRMNVASVTACLALFLAGAHCGRAAATVATNDEPLKVVLVYGALTTLPWNQVQDQALRTALVSGARRRIEFYPEKLQELPLGGAALDPEYVALRQKKYQDLKVDLVLADTIRALDFVERHREKFWPAAPVVFYNTGEADLLGRKVSPGITGQPASFDVGGTLDLAVRLQPDARHLVVVGGSHARDRYWNDRAAVELRRYGGTLQITWLTNQSLPQTLQAVGRLPPKTIVLYTSLALDATGQNYTPYDVLKMLAGVANAPVYGLNDVFVGQGAVGGSVSGPTTQGQLGARLALRVLAGEQPDTIPVQPPPKFVPTVDWQQLQRWNISEERLPSGSVVRFRPPTLWAAHKDYVIGGLCVIVAQAATIAALLMHRARRRRAEASARDLGGRLINAQEVERRRIARDLHDDLSQRLALLAVELEMFGQKPLTEREAIAGRMQEFSGTIKSVSSEVHRLAHELHPAKLDQLGLAAAVRGFCKELAAAHQIAIEFETRDVPRVLPDAVALCVYRVTQEALQNAVKHSDATGAKVELTVNEHELQLAITDDGHGFDLSAMPANGSLGIVSMRERVRMVQGQITVQSRPGEGTRIEVRVPITTL